MKKAYIKPIVEAIKISNPLMIDTSDTDVSDPNQVQSLRNDFEVVE